MVAELKEKEKEIAALNSKLAANRTGELLQNAQRINGVVLLTAMLSGMTPEMLRTMGDKLRDKEPTICASSAAAPRTNRLSTVLRGLRP